MVKRQGLADKLKAAAVGAAITLGVLGNPCRAQMIPINSLSDLINDNQLYSNVAMDTDFTTYADNLMIRDPVTGIDSVVQGAYHMGFITYQGDGAVVAGYADNLASMNTPGAQGWMRGSYYSILPDGQRPEDIWIIKDGNNDGLGYYDTITGQWNLGSDDSFYTSKDILFGTGFLRGDLSLLPANSWAGLDGKLPHMVIDPVPEPSTVSLLVLGALSLCKRKRD